MIKKSYLYKLKDVAGKTLTFVFLIGTGIRCMHKSNTPSELKNNEIAGYRKITPPIAEKIEKKLIKHDDVRIDPYYWLKNRENEKVIQYLKEENDYTEKVLSSKKEFKEVIFQEFKSRVIEDESSVPVKDRNYFYQTKYIPGKQYPIYIRKNDKTESEEILIDVNKDAKGQSFYESSGPIMSMDQKLMAYAYDNKGRRFYTIKIKNLETKKLLPIKIENVSPNVIWSKNSQFFFYTRQDPNTLRTYQVYRYDIKNKKSSLVFEEKDETFDVYIYENLAKEFIFIVSASTLTTEVQYLKSSTPLDKFTIFSPRERGHEYQVYDGGDRFLIRTNLNAENFRLMETSLDLTEKSYWKELIPHRSDVYLEDASVFKSHFVLSEKKDGLDQLTIYDRKTMAPYKIPFTDKVYTVSGGPQAEYDTAKFRFEYESMRQPEQIFEIDFINHEQKLLKERKIPHFDPSKYETDRLWVTARDGKKIPVSVLRSKLNSKLINTKEENKSPLLIFGYGSYGHSITPWYSQTIFSLIDRGFVYAVAHVRGGSELGRQWYEQGRTDHKLNTFYDFIDVTEYFKQQSDIDGKNIFAMGGSAGGLLMGVIANLRPDLYKGIVAQVPFVDVVTTMLDDTIPLTTSEYDEWGNPNEKKYYDYILKYSPYDNVSSQKYPHMLITTGLHDSQVQYWEPAKWVAKLRTHNKNSSAILLKTNMDSGHGGASGRYEMLKEKSLEFAFILFALENY